MEDVPVYGTNSSSGAAQQHHNIFEMYQSFLGHFWNKDRMGPQMDDMKGMLDRVFPGVSSQIDQVGNALSDSNNPLGQIFGGLLGKGQA